MSKKPILTQYTIRKQGLKAPLTIALAADIHERNADDILELIKSSKPDIIAVAGDTLERHTDDVHTYYDHFSIGHKIFSEVAMRASHLLRFLFDRKNYPDEENSYRFLRNAAELAPVYMSLGNHEGRLNEKDYEFIKKNGIHLLDNSDETAVINNQEIRIGGLSTVRDGKWFRSFAKKDGFKILLNHHPEYYDGMISESDVDLVLSGHVHGGQVRIFGKGLISPAVGLFPKYFWGVYDNRLVVSAGCSNPVSIPRINNPREAVIIKLET